MSFLETRFIDKEAPIKEALKVIDKGAGCIALVVDKEQHLLGTVSDGDVRRGILQDISVDSPVHMIMNPSPIVINNSNDKDVSSIMREKLIFEIPVVDEQGRVIDIKSKRHLHEKLAYDNLIIIMAGGLGRRLRPLTNDLPKPMLKINGVPIIEKLISHFTSFGFYKFVVSVNYKGHIIKEYLGSGDKLGVEINYLEEHKPLRTAGCLAYLEEKPNKPIIIVNGDIVTDISLVEFLDFHTSHKASATMAVKPYEYEVPFGVVKLAGYEINEIVEKPIYNFFINAGIYILEPEILSLIPKGEVFSMVDLFDAAKQAGHKCFSFPIREEWLDVGRMEDYMKINVSDK